MCIGIIALHISSLIKFFSCFSFFSFSFVEPRAYYIRIFQFTFFLLFRCRMDVICLRLSKFKEKWDPLCWIEVCLTFYCYKCLKCRWMFKQKWISRMCSIKCVYLLTRVACLLCKIISHSCVDRLFVCLLWCVIWITCYLIF